MRVLVTRPRGDADGLAAELRGRGLEVMIEPLLEVVPLAGVQVDLEGVQGILVTSANGARALAAACPERGLPVWAVGDASAREARRLGYQRVESAGGDVHSLAALVQARVDPAAGALFHAAGSVTAGDLAGALGRHGFTVRRTVLYEARPLERLSPTLSRALEHGQVDAALFFSPRTATTFVRLIGTAGLAEALGRVDAYALSSAVAGELGVLCWRGIRTAAAPTQAALLAALDEDLRPPL